MSVLENNLINTYKTMVGLSNVDNTSDLNKPISNATQTALDSKLNLAGGTLIGGLTGTVATFSGDLTANGISISSLNSGKLNLAGGTLTGGLTGTSATFSGDVTANGISISSLNSGKLNLAGGTLTGSLTGTSATFSGDVTANGFSISSLNSGKLNLAGGVLTGGLTGTTASFSGPLIANGGITGTTASFTGLLSANGGLNSTVANFSGDVTANGISISSLNSGKLNLVGGTLTGGLTGTVASFSGPLIANGGITGTTANFSGLLSAIGGLTGTVATFSGDVTANGISISSLNSGKLNLTGGTLTGGLTGTTATFSGPLIANGGITGTTANFSGLLSANGGLTGTVANFSGDVTANGISISSLNSGKLSLTGGTLVGGITVPQITDLTVNNNTVATTSFVNSKVSAISLKLPVDLVSTTNQTLTSTAYNYDISNAAYRIVHATDFAYGTGNFTCEAWVNITSFNNNIAIFDTRPNGTVFTNGIVLMISSSGYMSYFHYTIGMTYSTIAKVELNTLTHIVYQRVGDFLQFYVNGVLKDTISFNQNLTSITNLIIGRVSDIIVTNDTYKFKGTINNIRITRAAVYSGNFTPSQTLSALPNTVLLITNSNPLIDTSGTNKTISFEGTTTYNSITIAGTWISGIDSVIPTINNRILFVGQTNQIENGIYVMTNSTTISRSSDFSLSYAASGTNVFIKSGTLYANTNWICTNLTGSDIVGTNSLIFNSIKTDIIPISKITNLQTSLDNKLNLTGGTLVGGLTGTTASFSGPLIANGGITGTTANFSGLLTANGGLTGTVASFSGDVTANGISISSLNSGKLNLVGGTLTGGLTGTVATFSGPLIANGGITGTVGSFSGLLRANGGLNSTTGSFSGDVTSNGISISSLNSGKLNLVGGTLTGGLTGTTATFSGPLIAIGGITGTVANFSGLLTANGGLTGTVASFSGDVTANGISISSLNSGKLNLVGGTLVGGLTGTTATFSGPLIANGGITGTTATFSGLLSANGGLNSTTGTFSGDVIANGISISSLNSGKLSLTGGNLTGTITVPQITDLTLNNNTVATTSFVTSKLSSISTSSTSSTLSVDLVSTTNQTLTSSGTWLSGIDSVIPTVNNRILFVGQTNQIENGIYVMTNSTTISRSSDFSLSYTASGTNVFIKSGTLYANTEWVCTNLTDSDIVGTNSLIFNSIKTATATVSGPLIATKGITGTTATFSTNLNVSGKISCNLPNYATNADAITAGLPTGTFYRTAGAIKIVI